MNIENPQLLKKNIPALLLSYLGLNLFEFIAVAKEWSIDFIQLGEGVFKSKLDQVIFSEFQLAHVVFNSQVKQEGRSPLKYWSFAFVEEDSLYWRNYKVSGKAVVVYAPGSEINTVSSANFETNIFSIEENILFSFFEKESAEEFVNMLNNNVITPTNIPLWERLNKEIFSEIKKHKENNSEDSKASFLTTFTISLIELIKTSSPSKNQVSSVKRLELLVAAEHYIQENITETITIPEIASHCRVSERTLLYAFKQRFGMGGKLFIRILKLNYVYFLLHKDMKGETITNAAQGLGFWHMGQFHTDYKRFFGELPSETTQKKCS